MKIGLKLFVSLLSLGTILTFVPSILTSCGNKEEDKPQGFFESDAHIMTHDNIGICKQLIENFLKNQNNIINPMVNDINLEGENVDFIKGSKVTQEEPLITYANCLTTQTQKAKDLIYNGNFLKLMRNSLLQSLITYYTSDIITNVVVGEEYHADQTKIKSLTLSLNLTNEKLNVRYAYEFWDTDYDFVNNKNFYTGNFIPKSIEYTFLYTQSNITCIAKDDSLPEGKRTIWQISPTDTYTICNSTKYGEKNIFWIEKRNEGSDPNYLSVESGIPLSFYDWASIKELFSTT